METIDRRIERLLDELVSGRSSPERETTIRNQVEFLQGLKQTSE